VERNDEIRLIYVKLLFTSEVKLRKFTQKLVKLKKDTFWN
jgi:hypothetical protein